MSAIPPGRSPLANLGSMLRAGPHPWAGLADAHGPQKPDLFTWKDGCNTPGHFLSLADSLSSEGGEVGIGGRYSSKAENRRRPP